MNRAEWSRILTNQIFRPSEPTINTVCCCALTLFISTYPMSTQLTVNPKNQSTDSFFTILHSEKSGSVKKLAFELSKPYILVFKSGGELSRSNA